MFDQVYRFLNLKLIGHLTVLYALIPSLILGLIFTGKLIRKKAKNSFSRRCKLLNSLQRSDIEGFYQSLDDDLGAGKWKLKTEGVSIEGLMFHNNTTVNSSLYHIVRGPICPVCEKPLSCDLVFSLLCIPRFKYRCLCGFQKILKKSPPAFYDFAKKKCSVSD